MKPSIVLVQGAWGSSAVWTPLAEQLRSNGHSVHVPSLTGLGERRHLFSGAINLSTHVADVESAIDAEALDRVILVGHSYGGMVITALADRLGERVAGMLYLDAFVPENGQSAADLIGPEAMLGVLAATGDGDGFSVPPPSRDPARIPAAFHRYLACRSAQPLATMVERVRLTRAREEPCPRHYVSAIIDQAAIFQRAYDRLRQSEGWTSETIDAGHILQLERLDEVAAITENFIAACAARLV